MYGMSSNNSFKQLMEEEAREHPQLPPAVKRKVKATMDIYELLGKVVDLYVVRMIDTFVLTMGDGAEDRPVGEYSRKDRTQPPSDSQ
jgi:hypothetical protein